MSEKGFKWSCAKCLGCQRMEMDDWSEPEYCKGSLDPERREKPVQMRMDAWTKRLDNS